MSVMSKRQQARNERELHELLRVQGNSQCADCEARNPGWASWNLGIFVCMRCASLHRKLGTHISKVKSLSMDTWTSEQVENMKRNGNIAVNKVYNPKNRRPDMPLDADEVDSAMERYIRKKYQEKSLSDGRPQPPRRDDSPPPPLPKSPESSPPPPVPSKKGRFFGFGLRASSSAYPLSKHDKKRLPPEPRVDSAFTISSDDYSPASRRSNSGAQMSDADLQSKLAQLRDMGFNDTERNINLLRRLNGNIERTVEGLVKFGANPGARTSSARAESLPTSSSRTNATTAGSSDTANSTLQSSNTSNNPFDRVSTGPGFGLSMAASQQIQPTGAVYGNNPFDQPTRAQTDTGLENSFHSLQLSQPVSQPLFPHSTGGYPSQPPPVQDPRFQYSMTPPVPPISQRYGYAASPTAIDMTSTPFFQNTQGPQAIDNNPFGTQQQQQHPSNNPFFNNQPSPQSSQQISSTYNPFGIPPSPQPPPQTFQPIASTQAFGQSVFDASGPSNMMNTPSNNPFQSQMQAEQRGQSPGQPRLPNFQYGQPQVQLQQQLQQQAIPQQQQQMPQFRTLHNPYQPQTQSQNQFPQFPPQSQAAPLMPQQTGRYDKNSILALYNYPQLAPQPLASIPEPSESLQQPSQPLSPAPTNNIFANQATPAKRSVTMPVSSMHSAGGGGSRNPFLQNTTSQPQNLGMMAQHASRESMSINNLDSGRHSPDAFASLSARYMR